MGTDVGKVKQKVFTFTFKGSFHTLSKFGPQYFQLEGKMMRHPCESEGQ